MCQRGGKRKKGRKVKVKRKNGVWELRREVSRDSVRAAVYSGMTARYTIDREGDRENEGGKVNESYKQ